MGGGGWGSIWVLPSLSLSPFSFRGFGAGCRMGEPVLANAGASPQKTYHLCRPRMLAGIALTINQRSRKITGVIQVMQSLGFTGEGYQILIVGLWPRKSATKNIIFAVLTHHAWERDNQLRLCYCIASTPPPPTTNWDAIIYPFPSSASPSALTVLPCYGSRLIWDVWSLLSLQVEDAKEICV
ncbi:hypothetical protein ES705_45040 [subsurface metagenome]